MPMEAFFEKSPVPFLAFPQGLFHGHTLGQIVDTPHQARTNAICIEDRADGNFPMFLARRIIRHFYPFDLLMTSHRLPVFSKNQGQGRLGNDLVYMFADHLVLRHSR